MADSKQGTILDPFPYRIEHRLATHHSPQQHLSGKPSSMTELYLASALSEDGKHVTGQVILKIIRVLAEAGELQVARLQNEAEQLSRLTHPGIVHVYPIRHKGSPDLPYTARLRWPNEPWFAVLEYIPGGSLAEFVAQSKQTPPIALTLEVIRQLAGILDYLHMRGVVHLKLQPENILFRHSVQTGQPAEPVLLDFSLASPVGQVAVSDGNLPYLAPERLVANPEAHPSMDIYALGVILYQMLSKRLPFPTENKEALEKAILQAAWIPPSRHQKSSQQSKAVETLDGLVQQMLDRNWQNRPSAAQVGRAIEEASLRLGYTPATHLAFSAARNRPFVQTGMQAPIGRRYTGVVRTAIGVALLAILAFAFASWAGLLRQSPVFGTQNMVGATPTIGSTSVPTSNQISGSSQEIAKAPAIAKTSEEANQKTQSVTKTIAPALTNTITTNTITSTDTITSTTANPVTNALESIAVTLITSTITNTTEAITPTLVATETPPTPLPPPPPTRTPVRRVVAQPPPVQRVSYVSLLEPANGAHIGSATQFCWSPNGVLGSDEFYEVAVWQAFEGPDQGQTTQDPTKESCTVIDLSALVKQASFGGIDPNETIRWGVFLKNTTTGQRQFLGDSREIIPQ